MGSLNPLDVREVAVARRDWQANDALTGSLTLGKRADIVVLSEDLFAIPRN